MANNAPFIGIDALTQLGCAIMPDIAMAPYYDHERTFKKLGIKVISGNEFQNLRYALRTKGHTTRRKNVGDTIESQAGKLVERKLVTYVAWNRYRVNKNMFRELPREVGGQLMYPNSELNLKVALLNFTGDLFDNLFFGNHESAAPEYSLYDGFYTYIAKDIEDGYITPIHLSGAIVRPTGVNDTSAWDLFVQFMDALDPALRRVEGLRILCSPATAAAIYAAYGHSHGDHKEMGITADGNYTVAEYPNIEIAFDDIVGIGCRLIATVPDNFEYGIDTLDPQNGMTIESETSRDNDDFIIQPQSSQGCRVFDVSPRAFAMTDAAMTFQALSGNYREIHVYVNSSDAEKGTVTIDGVAPDASVEYQPGQIVALKATNGTGTFKKWSDGNTTATRNYVVGAESVALTAIFE